MSCSSIFVGFIKKGKSMGSVEITIRNTGECGYKPNVYGRYIIVQRSFTATSSTYKIKSENGKWKFGNGKY